MSLQGTKLAHRLSSRTFADSSTRETRTAQHVFEQSLTCTMRGWLR